MPWCVACRTEYESGITVCVDCGAALSDDQQNVDHEQPVVIFEARSATEAQVVEATLEAEGIQAFVQSISSPAPNVGVMGDDVPELEVLVSPSDADRAREILSQPPVAEEELAAAAESDESEPVEA